MPSARSRIFLRLSKAVIVVCGFALIALGANAQADTIRVTQPTDYWFEFTDASVISVRTYEVQGSRSDPMLWLYNSNGQVLVANDDYYGLQSRLEVQVQPGWYRLRAGVCCGNPDAWWPGVQYDLWSSIQIVVPTTAQTTTTVETTTTTNVDTTTTVPEPSSTVTTWLDTTTTSSEPPTTVPQSSPETTQPSTTSSSTTTTRPDPTTTTSTTTLPESTTSTEQSTTTTEIQSSPSVQSSSTLQTPSTTSVTQSTNSAVSTTSPTTTNSVPLRPVATTLPFSSSVTSRPSETTEPGVTATSVQEVQEAPQVQIPQNEGDRASEAIVEALEGIQDPGQIAEAIEQVAANIDTLTSEQLDKIVEAVNKAPTEVKKAFEEEVNIFSAGLDNYIPADSNVNVGQRRALIAVGAVMAAAPAIVSRRK